MSSQLPNRALTRRAFVGGGSAVAGVTAAALLAACGAQPAPTATSAPAAATATSAAPATEPTATVASAAAATPTTEPVVEPTVALAAEPTATMAAAEPTVASAASPAAAAQVMLTIYTPYGQWAEGEITRVQTEYARIKPEVGFNPPVWGGEGQQSYLETLMARVAAGDPPDIAILWDTPVSLGVRAAVTPLDDLMKTSQYSDTPNWPEATLSGCVWQGKTFGFPTFNAVYCVYYNQDAFREKGIPHEREQFPKTWDEWKALSKQFTAIEGETPSTMGYVPVWHDDVYGAFFAMWTGLNGGSIYDVEGARYTIDEATNVETVQYALSWIEDEYGSYDTVKTTGCDFGSDSQPEPCWIRGQLIMRKGGNFTVGFYDGENPPQFTWEIAKFPIGPSGSGDVAAFWPNWTSMPTGGKNTAPAFEFLDWFNGDGVRYWSMTQPDLPANTSFEADFLPQIVVDNRGEEYAKDFQSFFFGQLASAARMWDSPVTTYHADQITRAIDRVFFGEATPEDALAEAQSASQAELDKVLSTQS